MNILAVLPHVYMTGVVESASIPKCGSFAETKKLHPTTKKQQSYAFKSIGN